MRSILAVTALALAPSIALPDREGERHGPAVGPLARAHAHNDYRHERPLLDALSSGFTSVEADIFLVDGALLVGHDRSELRPGRTLQALYLDPLRERVRRHGGRVYPGGPEFTLLVDIKDDAVATYRALDGVLARYGEMLSAVRDGRLEERAVRAVVSGNRPHDLMRAQEVRYAGVDGRLSDLESDAPAHFMPLLSDHWGRHFTWRGTGPFPGAERAKLLEIARAAHARGRRLRFWATPESPALWKELHDAGVDLINTDDLEGLRKFLVSQGGPRRVF